MRRTLVGDSQSTMQLNATPFSSRPVTSTRSSCSRPMRCWVWAATRSIGAPPSQRTRSRSCVARSLTTPTSRTRSGNGPTRSVAIRKTSPSWPSCTRRAQLEQRRVAALDVADGAAGRPPLARRRSARAPRRPSPPAASRRARGRRRRPARAPPRRCSSVGTATTAKSGGRPARPAARRRSRTAARRRATAPKRSPPGSTAPAKRMAGHDCSSGRGGGPSSRGRAPRRAAVRGFPR